MTEAASLLPVFVKLSGRRCLLIGAGKVALDKIGSLLKTGLRLRVVALHALPEIQRLQQEGKLEWIERPFEPADLEGNLLAIAATDSPSVNAAVYRAATERGVLCNSVDNIPNCDFFFGAVLSRGELQVAISTAGQSPAFAQRLRDEIDEQLPGDLASWLDSLGQLRREVLATQPSGEERKLLLRQLAQRAACTAPDCPARLLALAPMQESETVERQAGDSNSAAAEEYAGFVEPLAQETDEEPNASAATVHLVGAGPGDPELLTVKALRLIRTADVILHDDLVPQAILDLASPSAAIVNVGKRCGGKHTPQAVIGALMIEHARRDQSVVRLKGGDPLLFGRAAEEMAALAAAGVRFEIVPGITAALAAAAAIGCSLTDRDCASSVIFTTGHHAPPQDQPRPMQLQDATRIVYMPGRDLRPLAQQWLEEGLAPGLPCAVVSRAAQPGQQVQYTTLADLGTCEPSAAPSLLMAGWAVRQTAARSIRG